MPMPMVHQDGFLWIQNFSQEKTMSNPVDLYNSTYGNFQEQVLAEIRRETYGEDIGQNSWITTDEYDALYAHPKFP